MEGEEIGGTGQGTCSGSLDCNSLTAAKGSSTNEGRQGRGTHKRHHQIPPSPACAVILCPGGTVKSYETIQDWVYRVSLHSFIRAMAFGSCLLPGPPSCHWTHKDMLLQDPLTSACWNVFQFFLTSNTGLGQNFWGSSQPLCLFLLRPLPLLFNSSRSTRLHGLPVMSNLTCRGFVGNMGPYTISMYLYGKYMSLSSFWSRKQKSVSWRLSQLP